MGLGGEGSDQNIRVAVWYVCTVQQAGRLIEPVCRWWLVDGW